MGSGYSQGFRQDWQKGQRCVKRRDHRAEVTVCVLDVEDEATPARRAAASRSKKGKDADSLLEPWREPTLPADIVTEAQ